MYAKIILQLNDPEEKRHMPRVYLFSLNHQKMLNTQQMLPNI